MAPERVTVRTLVRLVRDMNLRELIAVLRGLVSGMGPHRLVELDTSIEAIFPEIKTVNRKEKIADILAAEQNRTFSHERGSNMIAAEMSVSEYDFAEEMAQIKEEADAGISAPGPIGPDPSVDEEPTEPTEPTPTTPGSDEDERNYRDEMDGEPH